ncbi:MAG TPA: HlyD family efflux transporter periplasmic adaptor subunit [Solirubrobacteraceae bacterium]|nr:HlyD family efflux transporter periplasmic adaptor subunit [Solirubrobacteraceae bacterium]
MDSATAALRTAEETLAKTRLYAPAAGTIVSLASVSPGDSVSAGSTGAAAASGSGAGSGGSGSGSGGSGSGGAGSGGAGSGTGSSSTGSGSGSSGAFAEIVDTSQMTMSVSFSESDITKVKVGQPATVSIDALSGVELAAHVSSISPIGSTSSGVVSYTATLALDQLNSQVRPGMSASATVIVAQAQGVTLPTQAISGSGSLATVQLERSGETVTQQVVVGLRGDTRVQIVSGLNAGQQVAITIVLPSLSSSSSSSGSGTLGGGRLGLGGGGGAGFLQRAIGGGGFGGAARAAGGG